MSQKYSVNLVNDTEKEELFEEMGDNIVLVNVFNQNGKDITNNCRVQITLSKNALLGLGTELIRLAHQYKNGKHFHIDPIKEEYVIQALGVMLHPASCELIVGCGDFKPYTEYTKEDI